MKKIKSSLKGITKFNFDVWMIPTFRCHLCTSYLGVLYLHITINGTAMKRLSTVGK